MHAWMIWKRDNMSELIAEAGTLGWILGLFGCGGGSVSVCGCVWIDFIMMYSGGMVHSVHEELFGYDLWIQGGRGKRMGL